MEAERRRELHVPVYNTQNVTTGEVNHGSEGWLGPSPAVKLFIPYKREPLRVSRLVRTQGGKRRGGREGEVT